MGSFRDPTHPECRNAPECRTPPGGPPALGYPAGVPATSDSPITVYTDGACSGNPGPGGWGWAVAPDGVPAGAGGNPKATNQRMEIQAVLEAIKTLSVQSPGTPIQVVSDSTYVVNCFRDRWWVRWEANGWRNSQHKPVANDDLWKPLIELVKANAVTFRWVKGHSGDRMNDLVDQLAVAAIPR